MRFITRGTPIAVALLSLGGWGCGDDEPSPPPFPQRCLDSWQSPANADQREDLNRYVEDRGQELNAKARLGVLGDQCLFGVPGPLGSGRVWREVNDSWSSMPVGGPQGSPLYGAVLQSLNNANMQITVDPTVDISLEPDIGTLTPLPGATPASTPEEAALPQE